MTRLEKLKAQTIDYFENNYQNLIYTTRSTDWSSNFEYKFQSDDFYPRFMSNLNSRMKVNLRRKTQKLCANKVLKHIFLFYHCFLLELKNNQL